jgi:hypothetical protein
MLSVESMKLRGGAFDGKRVTVLAGAQSVVLVERKMLQGGQLQTVREWRYKRSGCGEMRVCDNDNQGAVS